MGCDRWPIDLEPAVEAACPPVVLLASMMPHLDSPLAALCFVPRSEAIPLDLAFDNLWGPFLSSRAFGLVLTQPW